MLRYFECGNINLDNRGEDALKFNVTKLDDIISKVIAHFDNYPLLTSPASPDLFFYIYIKRKVKIWIIKTFAE